MGFLLKAFAGFILAAGGMTNAVGQRVAEPAELVFGRADSELKLKTEFFLSIFGDERYDWDVDLDAGTITFTGTTKVVTAPVQVIGTYNTLDQTFLWGWDHPSVPDALAADARSAREFGRRQDLPQFTTRKLECTQEQAWVFTAVALYLTGAQGAYRAPSGTTMVFVTFGKMTVAPLD